jgi:ferredoxin
VGRCVLSVDETPRSTIAPGDNRGVVPPRIGGVVRQEICATCEGPCTRACPESILLRHPADHACAGLPPLSFREAECTFCGACIEACPTDVPPSDARPVLGRADIDPTRCLAWKQVVCMACQTRAGNGPSSAAPRQAQDQQSSMQRVRLLRLGLPSPRDHHQDGVQPEQICCMSRYRCWAVLASRLKGAPRSLTAPCAPSYSRFCMRI